MPENVTCQDGLMRPSSPQYRGTIKHKRWRPGGGYGTLCPSWTHDAPAQGFAGDPFDHPWQETRAHAMLKESVLAKDGRRYATREGIAFAAVASGDGTWHGYPVPWQDVPRNVRDAFVREGRVTRRETRKVVDRRDVRWALGSEDV